MRMLVKSTSAILIALGLLAGCTKKSQSDYNLDLSETLRVNLQTEPPSLDWTISTDTTSSEITDNLMKGLVEFKFANEEVIVSPALATTWEASPDQKKWTFTMRQDVLWTDGQEFIAQHVVDGWERLLNPKTGSEYANFLFNVKNAEAYFNGKITDFAQVGVKAVGKDQLVVELETPQSYFPMLLAHHCTFPVRKDVIEKHGDKWPEPGNIVTLGPFKLQRWDHDKAVILERNEEFYGPKAKIKYVLGRIVHEQSTALNMFKKGEIDALHEIPSIEIEKVKQMKEYRKYPILGIYYYGFNTSKPPFDNPKVRKAIAMAIDRDEVNRVLGGEKIPATSLLPKGVVGHDPELGPDFNPEEAKKLLAEAGIKDASTLPRIQFGFNTNENHQRIAENIQAQLKRNLGLDMELLNEEWKTYLKSLQTKKAYDMWRLAWIGDFPDADTFVDLFSSTSGNNHTNWRSKKYDDLVRKGRSESDREKRRDIYRQAQKVFLEEEVPAVMIYHYTSQILVSDRIKNFPMNIMDKRYYHEVEVAK